MANFNLEMYLEELEKQGQSVKAGAESVLISLNTVRDNAESVIRATTALSEMVEITRRAMRLKREVRTAENPVVTWRKIGEIILPHNTSY